MPENDKEKDGMSEEGSSDGGMQEEEQPTQPTMESALAELERTRSALKRANSEAAERRKKLATYESDEAKRKEAELSEVERLKTQLAEAQERSSRVEAEMVSLQLRHAVERQAAEMGFVRPDQAYMLADLSSATVDDGQVSGVEEALKALAKDSPHLLRQAQEPPETDASKRGGKKDGQNLEEIKRRFGI